MAHIINRNQDALELIYDRYSSAIMGVAVRILGNRQSAEEVVQETFWRVWERASSFDAHRGNFKSWLFSIARRYAIDLTRRAKVRPDTAVNEVEADMMLKSPSDENVMTTVLGAIEQERVKNAVQSLSPDQYQVIQMAYYEGLTRKEIANRTQTPVGTIHTPRPIGFKKATDGVAGGRIKQMTKHIEELFPFYALDVLSDEEKQQVDAYIKQNPEAESRLRSYFEATAVLPFENDPIAPSPNVKQSLMARVQADKKPVHSIEKRSGWQNFIKTLLAPKAPAILVPAVPVLIGLLIFAFARNSGTIRQLNATITDQQSSISALQIELEEQKTTIDTQLASLDAQQVAFENLEATVTDQQVALSIYTAVNAETFTITSTGIQPEAAGKVTVDFETGRAVLDVIALSDDPGTVYQLWFIQDETPLPSTVFDVDATGNGQIVVSTAVPAHFDAIGITVEPPGGSEQPTGDLILLGSTSS